MFAVLFGLERVLGPPFWLRSDRACQIRRDVNAKLITADNQSVTSPDGIGRRTSG